MNNLDVTVFVSMGLVLRLQKHKQIAQLTIFNSALQQGSLTKIEHLSSQRESEALQACKHHPNGMNNMNITVVALMGLVWHSQKHKQIAQFAKEI